ncbi:MAG: hypothetical protein WBP93_01400 [Pyrinomonadaceae bacterium]
MRVKFTDEISDMDRGGLSVILGFLMPVCYAILSSRLAEFINNATFSRVLWFPFAWPSYIYYHFYPLDPDREFIVFDGLESGNILSIIIGNWVLYTLLAYAFLSWRARNIKLK